MAFKLETKQSSAIDGCVNQLDTLVNTVTETIPAMSTELSKLLSDLKEKPSMSTAFVHARSYITKCHELADYVCDEEQYTIKAIEEENVEEFKDYLEEVLSKSKGCHKDLQTLLEFIEREERQFNEKENPLTRKEFIEREQRHFNEEEDSLTRKNNALINTGIGIVAGIALGILGGILLRLYCNVGVLVVAGIVVEAVIVAMAKIMAFVKGIIALIRAVTFVKPVIDAMSKIMAFVKVGVMGIIIHLKRKAQVSHQGNSHEIQLHLYNIEKRLGGVNSRFKLTLDDYLVNKRFYYQH